jgi:hypothetical protein
MCDHPRATRRDYLEKVLEIIERTGWFVQGVSRDGLHPPWAYTVGLTLAGRPELVVTGLPFARALCLLNDVAEHVLHADVALTPGERTHLIGGPAIEIVEMSETTARLVTAIEIYGRGIRALQLVYTDDRGQWPWERGYRGHQHLLGRRASPPATAA